MKVEIYAIVTGLILKKDIYIVMKHPDSNITYSLLKFQDLGCEHIINAITSLGRYSHEIEKRRDKISEGIRTEYLTSDNKNPLSILKIVSDVEFTEHEFEYDQIPKYIDNKVEELLFSLGIIFSASIHIISFIVVKETDKGLIIRQTFRSLNQKVYINLYEQKNPYELTNKYLLKLIESSRQDNRISKALMLYQVMIDTEKQKIRIIIAWTILEILSSHNKGDTILKRVQHYAAHFMPSYDISKLREFYYLRNKLIHEGNVLNEKDYDTAIRELRELIEQVIFKEMDAVDGH